MVMSDIEMEEMIAKFKRLPKNDIDAFGVDRGVVKGHGGKEGGSYKRARMTRGV